MTRIQINYSDIEAQLIKDPEPSGEYKKVVEEANKRIIEGKVKQQQAIINAQNYYAL